MIGCSAIVPNRPSPKASIMKDETARFRSFKRRSWTTLSSRLQARTANTGKANAATAANSIIVLEANQLSWLPRSSTN